MKAFDENTYQEIAEFIYNKLYKDEKGIDLELFVSEIHRFTFAYIKYASVHLGGGQKMIEFLNRATELLQASASAEDLYKPEVDRITSLIEGILNDDDQSN